MEKKYDILCIGLVNVNLLVKPADKGIFDRDVTLVEEISSIPGGDATNEAVVMARLGNKVGLMGKVGDDDFGRIILQSLHKDGVNAENIKIDKNARTSACAVLIKNDGSRNFATFRGANSVFSINDIDLSEISKARTVNIGSMFALKQLDGHGARTIFKRARESGVITAADMKADTYNIGFEGIKNVICHTDYFLPSYDEAAYLTGEKNPERMARALLNAGAGTVVIKLGKDGCYIKSASESHSLRPYDVEVEDTTGAGDNFVAGFLTGVIKGWGLEKCGRFANAVASISVQKTGATTAVKSMEQVEEFLKSRNEVI